MFILPRSRVGLCVALCLGCIVVTSLGWRVSAQIPGILELEVAAGSSVRTADFGVAVGEEMSVTLVDASPVGQTNVNVYVYAESGVLVSRDDADSRSSFSWVPPVSGRYYVILENTGTGRARVRVQTAVPRVPVVTNMAAEFATVRVLFGTDRKRVDGSNPVTFGGSPGDNTLYGYSDVSIPRDHKLGELEGPSILRLEVRSDPNKHITLLDVRELSFSEFSRRLSGRLKSSKRKEILLFVHGFNVTFDDALRRTAQLAYDLTFDGPAVAFSWPSEGSALPLAYTKDQRNADLSAQSLERFLAALTSMDQTTIHVVAHSMGNRVLAGALQRIVQSTRLKNGDPILREVALLAPDIDSELFKRAAKQIASHAHRVTLYASSRDGALALAQRVSGYSRAGQAGPNLLVVPGMHTIDASDVDTSLLGLNHSYFADNTTILSDLYTLLRGQSPEQRFGLQPINGPNGVYWKFRPAIR